MTNNPEKPDIVKKQMMPHDAEFLANWTKQNHLALIELAQHFCRFPGDVEVGITLKKRSKPDGEFSFTFGDITASREEIREAFDEHAARKEARKTRH